MANTQNFRVKHGLEVAETASFSNTVSVTGNVTITNSSLIITNSAALSINAQGQALFGNTVTVANGGINVYSFSASAGVEGFKAIAANSSVSRSLTVNTTLTTVGLSLIHI